MIGNPKKEKKDVRISSTYKSLVEILVDDAMATLPKIVYKEADINFLYVLDLMLKEMRVNGYSYIYIVEAVEGYNYITEGVCWSVINGEKILKMDTLGKSYNLSSDNLIEFGNKNKPKLHMLAPLASQLTDIARYENAVERLDQRDDISTFWFYKSEDYDDYLDSGALINTKKIKEKLKNLINRNEKSISLLGKEDEVNTIQSSMSDVSINKLQEKIALTFKIPYSRLFKGPSSGFNQLDDEDRKNWNNQIRAFQLVNIMPALKQYFEIIGKTEVMKDTVVEPIEDKDKELQATLEQMKFNQITTAFSLGLVGEDKAKELTNNLLTGGK